MSAIMIGSSPPLPSASDGPVLDLLAASDSRRERERCRMNERETESR